MCGQEYHTRSWWRPQKDPVEAKEELELGNPLTPIQFSCVWRLNEQDHHMDQFAIALQTLLICTAHLDPSTVAVPVQQMGQAVPAAAAPVSVQAPASNITSVRENNAYPDYTTIPVDEKLSADVNKMSNVSSEMEPTKFFRLEHLFTILVLSLTALLGVPGNALVLWVTGVKMERTVTTIWFGNLALADIMCCLCLPFIVAQFFYREWLYGPVLCKILPFIVPLNMYTSVFTLVAISADRWILVVHPVWARNHRRIKMAWMICLAIWMLSFVVCLPVAINKKYHYNYTICYSDYYMLKPINLTCAIFGFLIPLIIICICYIHLAFKAQNIRCSAVGRKITKMAISIIVWFFITWAPFHIIRVTILYTYNEVVSILDLLALSLAMFNSCVNPILYVFMGKDMKQKLRQSIGELMQNILRENVLSPPCSEDQRPPEEEESLPL
ncbi:C3a anaphylatoxin chemotactic receptor-like [Rana temporaria]|uniref:C3a anaphylatoxin chemotactic receptor-like n=1 Tax=Rana temporaria TaxID=8407 RepID=UPI001AAC7FF9|nr:C3a anaphylatoxin chemotactic receptor-like [Rana temporaria]